jgi:hypothetical protein
MQYVGPNAGSYELANTAHTAAITIPPLASDSQVDTTVYGNTGKRSVTSFFGDGASDMITRGEIISTLPGYKEDATFSVARVLGVDEGATASTDAVTLKVPGGSWLPGDYTTNLTWTLSLTP